MGTFRSAGLPVEVARADHGTTLPAAVDLAAYRIIQEALTNVQKHAGPEAKAEVSVVRVGPRMEITVLDNGAGEDDAPRRRRRPRLLGMVNNAGVGGNPVAEECPTSTYLDIMNVNLCGAVRCLQQVLPGIRARRSGAIVNITSITGRVAAIAQSPYVTSKWAFEGLSEGLAQELAPFGIRVVIIEPGVTKSAIFAKNIDAPNQSGAYDAQYRRMFQFYTTGHGASH